MKSVIKDYAGVILLALISIAGFGGIGWLVQTESPAPTIPGVLATPSMSQDERNAPDLLVDVPWLESTLATTDLVIDLTDQKVYDAGHIPSAVHYSWQDFMKLHTANYGEALGLNPTDGTSLDRIETKAFDVKPDATIVVYDANNNERASWVTFVLRTNGYSHVWTLDGGLAAWKGASNELETTPNEFQAIGEPTQNWIQANVIKTDELAARIDDPALAIVDIRNASQQADTVNETLAIGQIPHSLRVDPKIFLKDNGTYQDPWIVKSVIEAQGIRPDQEIVVYGRFGSDAGNAWMQFHRAGFHRVRIYDDGYVQWGTGNQHPIEPLGTVNLSPTPVPTASPVTEQLASPAASPSASPAASPVASPVATPTQQPTPTPSPTPTAGATPTP